MKPMRSLLLLAGVAVVACLFPLDRAIAEDCESESGGCLPWGETVIGRIGSSTAARVSVLSGDGQTAMLSEQDGSTAQGASWRLGSGKEPLDLGTLEVQIASVVFTDLDDNGECGTGWYVETPVAGAAMRGFLMDWNNDGMRIRRRPDRLAQPSGSVSAWGLNDTITMGIDDSCGLQVGASRAAPTGLDTTPIWGRIGMVWDDLFPFASDLPPTVEGSTPDYLFHLDDAEEQNVDWPSVYSGANAISPNGFWVAGFTANNVTKPAGVYIVPAFPAVWNLLTSATRIDFPALAGSITTDIVGDLLGFTSVGFTHVPPAPAQAWRASGPVPPVVEMLGNVDPDLAGSISITSDEVAVVPRPDDSGVRFYTASGSFTSSERLTQLGLQEVVVAAEAVSSDGYIWGGNRGNDAVVVNTQPLKAAFLGDSYSSGEGARDWPSESLAAAYEAGTANESTNLCHRSVHAPAYLVKPRGSIATLHELGTDISLGEFTWDFVACSGATTANFFDTVQGFKGTGIVYSSPDNQVQANRIPSDVNLIAFTIGGNDAAFSDLMTACIVWDCVNGFFGLELDTVTDAIMRIRTTVRENLEDLYEDLRANFSDAEIFALGYPVLFEEQTCNASLGISEDEASSLRAAARVLNEVIRLEAQEAGFHFVPVESHFEGRNVCGLAPAINGIDPNRVFSEQGLQENLHPNIDGAALYAEALSEYLAHHSPFNAVGLPDGD